MSFYHLTQGLNPCTFLVLPMLGKHPEEYPRFRDCFTHNEERPEFIDHIHVYTRTGGSNRKDYAEENQKMRDMEGFVADFDDNFDCTYASWVFTVPEKWRPDFDKIKTGQVFEVSPEYQAELRRVYPKLNDFFDKLFALKPNPPNKGN